MDYAAIRHQSDKNYCYAIEKGHFVFRLQVKKGDIKRVTLHYQDKYIPVKFRDTRAQIEMNPVACDDFLEYYEAELKFDVVCLRYYFEIEDMEGKVTYYSSYQFQEEPFDDIERLFDCPQNLREEEMFHVPEWAANKVVYQIFPSRFATDKPVEDDLWYKAPIGAMDDLKGNLRGIINHLDYLQELGVDALYMTPIFKSDSTHKYDTIDYYQIDPSFGTKEDLKELVEKAHARNMRVLLDGVFNHTGLKFFAFADIMEKEEKSEYLDWYYIQKFPLTMKWGERPSFKTYSYFGGMPKLNLSNKVVQDYVIDIARYWIRECDIDGWRLDVGDEVSHKFWKRFRDEVKDEKEDTLIVGEVWHYAPDFLEGDEWDTVMNYLFLNAVRDLLVYEKLTVSEFINKLGFIKGNHHTKVYPVLFNLIDSHDTARFLHLCGNDKKKQKLGAAFQLLFPGMPMIYYGDEFAMEGAHDPDCRRGMLWDKKRQDRSMFAWYQKLIAIRKKYKSLTEGKVISCEMNDEKGILKITRELGEERVTMLFHCKAEPVMLENIQDVKDLITDERFDGNLKGYQVVVFEALFEGTGKY